MEALKPEILGLTVVLEPTVTPEPLPNSNFNFNSNSNSSSNLEEKPIARILRRKINKNR